jgi:hypothetical protein
MMLEIIEAQRRALMALVRDCPDETQVVVKDAISAIELHTGVIK